MITHAHWRVILVSLHIQGVATRGGATMKPKPDAKPVVPKSEVASNPKS